MGEVIHICNPDKIWDLDECNRWLPLIRRLSNECDTDVSKLLAKQRYLIKTGARREQVDAIDPQVVDTLKRWGGKIARLGVKVNSGYLLFHSGWGYYNWLPGEESVRFCQYYGDPITTRRPV